MELTITRYGADAVAEFALKLKPIYADAYSDPPYEYSEADADEFVERIMSQSNWDNFTLIIGCVHSEIAGFSYGYTFPQDRWWRGAIEDPPHAVASSTKFAAIELVVHRPYRGNGYSRLLLDCLLTDRDEELGILLSKPGSQAHAMYQRWGWEKVGEVRSYPHWPIDDAFILPLKSMQSPDLVSSSKGAE